MMFQIVQKLKRILRYIFFMFKHITFVRFINFLIVEWELFTRKTVVKGYPYYLFVEPTNICQLKCPLCHTGANINIRPKGKMDLGLLKRIVDQMGKYAFNVFLHNKGEPLLHDDIFHFINYCSKANVGTTISTNFNCSFTEEKAEMLIRSGLESLVVSIDGATQETYAQYRIGGDFTVVIRNLEILLKKKKYLRVKNPFIEWQFLILKHNEKDIQKVKKLARDMGVDSLVFIKAVLPFGYRDEDQVKQWFPTKTNLRIKQGYDMADNMRNKCWFLWWVAVINYDGGISPCCYVADKSTDFGKMSDHAFREIWNNGNYRFARSLFTDKRGSVNLDADVICKKCSLAMRQ